MARRKQLLSRNAIFNLLQRSLEGDTDQYAVDHYLKYAKIEVLQSNKQYKVTIPNYVGRGVVRPYIAVGQVDRLEKCMVYPEKLESAIQDDGVSILIITLYDSYKNKVQYSTTVLCCDGWVRRVQVVNPANDPPTGTVSYHGQRVYMQLITREVNGESYTMAFPDVPDAIPEYLTVNDIEKCIPVLDALKKGQNI